MRGGYPVEKVHVDSGDVLFLYTDGIEEAKRLYRDNEGRALKFRDETDILAPPNDKKRAMASPTQGGFGQVVAALFR